MLEGALALTLLCALQFAVTWLSVRSGAVKRIVKAEPRLLYFRGEPLDDVLRAERVTVDEVEAAVRQSGKGSPAEVAAVVLETDGSLTVIAELGDDGLRL